jgi:hypothetical protein
VASLYLDEYEFTGGAHGATVRSSDTWNALTGQRIALSTLFPAGLGYVERLKELIYEEIERRNGAEPGQFVSGYQAVIEEAFSENNFYLTPGELVIYFQQYDIAPYSTGIPTFAFPYGLIGANVPKCG